MDTKIDWLMNMQIAHRGYHSPTTAPENSMKAFQNAMDQGFAIELDVHLLKDGNIAVFHDDNLERMTGYPKDIEECTYEEIKALKLLGTAETIPLFSELLSVVDGRVPLMIELKNKGTVGILEKAVYELLKTYSGEFVVQSFNPYSMGWFHKNAPEIIRGQLSGSYKDEKMGFYKKFLLRNMLLNKVSKPHFINYELAYLSCYAVKRKRNIPILGWTARSKVDYQKAKQQCDNVVFEGFNPKEI